MLIERPLPERVVEPLAAIWKKVVVALKSSDEEAIEKTPERLRRRKCWLFVAASVSEMARAGVMEAT